MSFYQNFIQLKNKKSFLILFLLFLQASLHCHAQIGYQVALINNATGEPRVLETVNVEVSISNNVGKIIFSDTQSATTNDFGIISLSVGNSETFKDMDWSKLPLFISAKVDGILLGRTQILSVPIAEFAKETGVLTVEKLCEKIYSSTRYESSSSEYISLNFNIDGSGEYYRKISRNTGSPQIESYNFIWYKLGDTVIIKMESNRCSEIIYIPEIDKIYDSRDGIILSK